MSVTSGTKLPDGTVITRGDTSKVGSVRCLKCKSLAYPHTKPNGKKVLRCSSCGREWTSVAF